MKIADRAAGAVVGALIGDALGLGPHWYYNLDELHKDYGDWITGYTAPKPGRYHGGMRPGELSQTGLILVMLLRSGTLANTRKKTLPSDWTASFFRGWTERQCKAPGGIPISPSVRPSDAA
jgi:ADP-ribosylglycohydrolase